MNYKVVFDIATAGNERYFSDLYFAVFMVLVGILFVILMRKGIGVWKNYPIARKVFSYIWLTGAIGGAVVSFVDAYQRYTSISNAISTNNVCVVEGAVSNFKPMPITGHAMERFCVSGKCFEYSDFVRNGGFNNTMAHGGPIQDGLQVRVTYFGNVILKLEIARNKSVSS